MKLRSQLLLAAAIVLFLPWAGYRYVLELDDSLRQQQTDSLTTLARSAAAIVRALPNADVSAEPPSPSRVLFAQQISAGTRVVMDGYLDDWPVAQNTVRSFYFGDNKTKPITRSAADAAVVDIYAMQSPETLYLFFRVTDDKPIFHNPQKHSIASGDHLLIRLPVGERLRNYAVSASAPGVTEARYWGKRVDGVRPILIERKIYAVWQDTASGYNLELRMPLPISGGAFGVAIADVDNNDAERRDILWTGTFDPRDKSDSGRLLFADETLQNALSHIAPRCGSLRVFDANRWLLAAVNGACNQDSTAFDRIEGSNFLDVLLQRVFEYVLRPSKKESAYAIVSGRLEAENPDITSDTIIDEGDTLTATHMLRERPPSGLVLASQDVNTAQSMSTQALVKLFSLTVFAALIVSVALLSYASILSWRIHRLRDHTVSALDDRGGITETIPSKAKDEIGELSRGLSEMLSRIRGYTDYQKSLASRLTHELRTPLTVTRTSLESIDEKNIAEGDKKLLERADSGVKQLSRILQDLSEATRVEQIVGDVETENLNLVEFAHAAVDVYRSIYPERQFSLKLDSSAAHVLGNPELLGQLLDKLIANAVSFSALNSNIVIGVHDDEHSVTLAVINKGPGVPEGSVDLFSPMVTLRNPDATNQGIVSDAPHLGMGLYVARLIAERHAGVLSLQNDEDINGVRVSLSIPKA